MIPEGLVSALAGRYTIERELGRGGMATVYLAQDLRHGRDVALKVLDPQLAHALGPERFRREITERTGGHAARGLLNDLQLERGGEPAAVPVDRHPNILQWHWTGSKRRRHTDILDQPRTLNSGEIGVSLILAERDRGDHGVPATDR